jgi:hypothetical protein
MSPVLEMTIAGHAEIEKRVRVRIALTPISDVPFKI